MTDLTTNQVAIIALALQYELENDNRPVVVDAMLSALGAEDTQRVQRAMGFIA